MIKATYMCEGCGKSFRETLRGFSCSCPACGSRAVRTFENISSQKEDSTVSAAIQTMLYSKNPSGNSKSVY